MTGFSRKSGPARPSARIFCATTCPRRLELLDLDSLELTKDSSVDRRLRQHYLDLLYRLKFKDGRPGFVYFLLEHSGLNGDSAS